MSLLVEKEYIKNKSKIILSKQLRDIENAGFGYLSEICRVAIFENQDYEEKLIPIFLKNNPEIIVK